MALATASSNLGYYFEVAPIRIENYSLVFNSVLTSKLTNQILFGLSYFNQIFHDSNNTFSEQALGLYTSTGAVGERAADSGRSESSDLRFRSGGHHAARGPE